MICPHEINFRKDCDRHSSVCVDCVSVVDSASIQGNDAGERLLITVLFILPFRKAPILVEFRWSKDLILNHL